MKLTLFTILLFSTILSACSKSAQTEQDEPEKQNNKRYIYQGPLEQLFENKTLNENSFLNLNNVYEFSVGYHLIFQKFSEFEVVEKEKKWAQIKTEKKATEVGELSEASYLHGEPMFIKQVPDNKVKYQGHLYDMVVENFWNNNTDLVFHLIANENGDLQIQMQDLEGYELTTVSYSANPENKLYSILVHRKAKDKWGYDRVYAFYIQKPPKQFIKPELLENDKYIYLLGKKHKIRWAPGSIVKISLCGKAAIQHEYAILPAIKKWADILGPYINIEVEYLREPPPFNDVSTNCIYMEDDLYLNKKMVNRSSGSLGFTMTHKNYFTNTIISSNIFLNTKILDSYNSLSDLTPSFFYTIQHELGHFFGLHHMFEGEKSIMDYPDDEQLYGPFELYKIQDYDKEAIDYLYSDVAQTNQKIVLD